MTESLLKTIYVDIVALVSLVPTITTVLRENFVVIMMTNAQQLVLENRVPIIPTVVLGNVVMLMTNVQQPVLENGVPMIATALRVSLVVMLMTCHTTCV